MFKPRDPFTTAHLLAGKIGDQKQMWITKMPDIRERHIIRMTVTKKDIGLWMDDKPLAEDWAPAEIVSRLSKKIPWRPYFLISASDGHLHEVTIKGALDSAWVKEILKK